MDRSSSSISVSSPQKILWNTIFSTFSEFSLFFTFLFFILVARFLGDTAFGQFSSALAFVGIFTLLVIFGFSYSITKWIVRDRSNSGAYTGAALIVQFGLTLLCFGITYGTALLFHHKYPHEVRMLILLVYVAECLKCYTLTLRSAVKALGGFHFDTLAMNAERVVLVVLGGILLLLGKGLYTAAGILVFSRMISFVLLYWAVHRLSPDGISFPGMDVCIQLVRESWIYMVQSLFWRVYDYIDVVLLSLLSTFEATGWYGAGRRILEGLWIIPNILTEALYPELNARHLVSPQLVKNVLDKAVKYLMMIGFGVCIGVLVLSKSLVQWFYGSAFQHTANVLLILGLTIVPSYLRYVFGNTLIAINLQKKEIEISAGRSIFNILANVILISRYGFLGAAVATVLTDFFALGLYLRLLYKVHLAGKAWIKDFGKSFASFLCVIPLFWGIRGISAPVQCLVLLGTYLVFLWIFRALTVHEMVFFYSHLAGKWREFIHR
ncbi:MAG: flippase [Rhodocyclaceae bacterium]|nr:flippase [Rhodocyclaceae bacterium]